MKKLVKSLNKNEVKKMTTELKSFESIEKSVRQQMLSEVAPELGSFFFQQYQELKQENPEK